MERHGARGRARRKTWRTLEDQGEIKALGGIPLGPLRSPGLPGLSSGFGLPSKQSSYANPSSFPYDEPGHFLCLHLDL